MEHDLAHRWKIVLFVRTWIYLFIYLKYHFTCISFALFLRALLISVVLTAFTVATKLSAITCFGRFATKLSSEIGIWVCLRTGGRNWVLVISEKQLLMQCKFVYYLTSYIFVVFILLMRRIYNLQLFVKIGLTYNMFSFKTKRGCNAIHVIGKVTHTAARPSRCVITVVHVPKTFFAIMLPWTLIA